MMNLGGAEPWNYTASSPPKDRHANVWSGSANKNSKMGGISEYPEIRMSKWHVEDYVTVSDSTSTSVTLQPSSVLRYVIFPRRFRFQVFVKRMNTRKEQRAVCSSTCVTVPSSFIVSDSRLYAVSTERKRVNCCDTSRINCSRSMAVPFDCT